MARKHKKRVQRGRSATGIGFTVGVRCQPQLLKSIDNWRRSQEDAPSRPEAIRRLVEQALPAPPTKHGGMDTTGAERSAEKMAGEQIDRILEHSDQPAPVKTKRKKRLTKRPAELR